MDSLNTLKDEILNTNPEDRNRMDIIRKIYEERITPNDFFEWASINQIIPTERKPVNYEQIDRILSYRLSDNDKLVMELYLNEIRQYEPLNEEETENLFKNDMSKYYTEQICKGYLGDVLQEAVYFNPNDFTGEIDNSENANIGLIQAINHYDGINKGYRFYPYMLWWVDYSIYTNMQMTREVVLPPEGVELIKQIKKTRYDLSEELGREPTEEELKTAVDSSLNKETDEMIRRYGFDENVIEHAIFDKDSPLSQRERRVLELVNTISDGKTINLKRVAHEIMVTTFRVKKILERIYKKLSDTYRTETDNKDV